MKMETQKGKVLPEKTQLSTLRRAGEGEAATPVPTLVHFPCIGISLLSQERPMSPAPFMPIALLCWPWPGLAGPTAAPRAPPNPPGFLAEHAQPHHTPAATKFKVKTRNSKTNTNPSHGSQYF